jgi:hypothetical protein
MQLLCLAWLTRLSLSRCVQSLFAADTYTIVTRLLSLRLPFDIVSLFTPMISSAFVAFP